MVSSCRRCRSQLAWRRESTRRRISLAPVLLEAPIQAWRVLEFQRAGHSVGAALHHGPRRAEGQHFEVAAQLLAVPHLSVAALGVLAAARLDVDFLQADSLGLLQFGSFLWCHLMSQ